MSKALTQADIKAIAQEVALLLTGQQPVASPAPAPAKRNDFHQWIVDTAPARHARKATNRELAADLDVSRPGWRGASNLQAIWAAAKAGKRVPAVK